MSIQLIKQYAAWLTVVGLIIALGLYGIKIADNQTLLKIAVNKNDPMSMEIVSLLKSKLSVAGGYQVAVVKTKNSRESQSTLLKGDVDMAVVLPGALTQSTGLKALAPLARVSTFILVDKDFKNSDITHIDPQKIALGSKDSDQYLLLEGLFSSIGKKDWIENASDANFDELLESSVIKMGVVTTHIRDNAVKVAMETGGYRLQGLPSEALSLYSAFWQPRYIPPAIFLADKTVLPAGPVETVSSFAAIVATQRLNDRVAVEVAKILNSADVKLALAPFGVNAAAVMDGYQLLPQHTAVARSLDTALASRYAASTISFLMDYGYFILLLVVIAVMITWRLNAHKAYLGLRRQSQTSQKIDGLIQEIQSIEPQITSAHDLRALRGLYEQVQSIRNRGSRLILAQENFSQARAYLFNEHCQFALLRLESRIGLMQPARTQLDRAA